MLWRVKNLKYIFFILIYFCASTIYAEETSANFLVFADIHFDPYLSCQRNKPCKLIQQLKTATISDWPKLLTNANSQPSTYHQDSNYILLKSALIAAKNVAEQNQSKFVLVLGDFLGHDYRSRYQQFSRDYTQTGYQIFVDKTLKFLQQQIQEALPNTAIYSLVGNNDSYQNHYSVDPNGLFFKNSFQIWSQSFNANSSQKKSFNEGGYYSLTPANQPNLKIIFLNSVLFSTYAHGYDIQKTAEKQLQWLRNELAEAKSKQQKVFIAMHIPFGVDVYNTIALRYLAISEFWKANYLSEFNKILKDNSSVITAMLTAHLHADWFQMIKLSENQTAIPIIGTPAISPLFGNNPGFKTYEYNLSNLNILNTKTYFKNLANDHAWALEYNFHDIYQANCKNCGIISSMQNLSSTNEIAKNYIDFYSVNHQSQPITGKSYPLYWCAQTHFDSDSYRNCIRISLNDKRLDMR